MDIAHSFQRCLLWLSGGMGPWREYTPVWMLAFTPRSFTAFSFHDLSITETSIAFRTHQGELNLKTSPFSGSGCLILLSHPAVSLPGNYGAVGRGAVQRLKFPSGSSIRDKLTCQNKKGRLGAVLVLSERWENLVLMSWRDR